MNRNMSSRGMIFFGLLLLGIVVTVTGDTTLRRLQGKGTSLSGTEAIERGHELFALNKLDEAAEYFWHAIMRVEQTQDYTAPEVFNMFMSCFGARDQLDDGFLLVGEQYLLFRQYQQGFDYIETSLRLRSSLVRAHLLWAEYADLAGKSKHDKEIHIKEALKYAPYDIDVQ